MMRQSCVILITHTPERLRRTILGIAWSSICPQYVVLSCDVDDPAIVSTVSDAAQEAGISIILVRRAFAGCARPSQVRNNAVRELLNRGVDTDARLVFFDGDCVPLYITIEEHLRALEQADFVIGWRYELTREQDAQFDEQALRSGAMPFVPTYEQSFAILRRHRRYARQRFWKRFGLTKPHKPKLLSANFACSLDIFQRVNGFDESFEGWGQEDDDFGCRLYQAGGCVHIGICTILACHQYHATRAPGNWSDSANSKLLNAGRPTRCVHGLDNPTDQAKVVVSDIC